MASNGRSNGLQGRNGISASGGAGSAAAREITGVNGRPTGNKSIATNGKPNGTYAKNGKSGNSSSASTALAEHRTAGVTGASLLPNSPAPRPVVKIDAPADPKAPTLNFIEGIQKPVSSYNVIVGAFRKSKNAYNFRNKMRRLGYQAAIFRSDIDSKILRVCIYSTNNQEVALKQVEKARAEVVQGAWVHVFTK
jgi:cell division septation protein DedD